MNVAESSNQKLEGFESWSNWIGNKVCVNGNRPGILKYFGQTQFADGIWCGVELNEPLGKNNGSVKGVQYFTCKDNHGIFVSLNKVEKVHTESACDRNTDRQKRLTNRRFTLHSEAPREKICSLICDEEMRLPLGDKRRKTTFYNFPNDNVSTMPHSQKSQLNNSYVISVENKDCGDILNETVILTEENVVRRDDRHIISTDEVNVEKNSILNSTFDVDQVLPPEVINNNKETGLDGTFVLEEQNLGDNQKTLLGNVGGTGDFTPNETDESLCIMSLTQMKDFTICAEPFLNDSNAKSQSLHFTKSAKTSNMQQRNESKPPSRAISSELGEVDLKLCQENAVLEDSVFSPAYIKNDNDIHIRGSNRMSENVSSRIHSDELKDICFQPSHEKSSTPADQSKLEFIKKISLIKSFQLEDSFKFELKRHSSSTPNKPTTSQESLLIQSDEFILHADVPDYSIGDHLDNINLSLIINEAMPHVALNTTNLIPKEHLKLEERMPDNCQTADLILHPVEAGNLLYSTGGENLNARKLAEGTDVNFSEEKAIEIISQSNGMKSSESSEPLENNLNITRDLDSAKIEFDLSAKKVLDNMKQARDDSSLHNDKVSVSYEHSIVNKLESTTNMVNNAASSKASELGSERIYETPSVFPCNDVSVSIQKSQETVLDRKRDFPVQKQNNENDIFHKSLNNNRSYTIPQNISYTISVDEVNEPDGNTMSGKLDAAAKPSSELECCPIQNVPSDKNSCSFPTETISSDRESESALNVTQNLNVTRNLNITQNLNVTQNLNATQNLNSTVCISSNVNDHNLTFDVAGNSESDLVKTNRLNFPARMPRQSVIGPVLCKTNAYNKATVPKTASLKSISTDRSSGAVNSNKMYISHGSEKSVPGKFGDSVKQNADVQSQKPINRRHTIAPKISGSQENKSQVKNQVVPKINTNLKTSRMSLPRQPPCPPENAKHQLDSDNSVFKVPETKTIKNALNYQRIRQDAKKENDLDRNQKYPPGKRKVITPSSENKSFVLKENTQAVNVSAQKCDKEDTKVGIPVPSLSRRGSSQSVSSQSSSKITTPNKSNAPKTSEAKDFNARKDQKLDLSTRRQANTQKPNTSLRSPRLNDSASSQKTVPANAREKQISTLKKPETPRIATRMSEGVVTKRGIPRRVSCLPKLKPVQQHL